MYFVYVLRNLANRLYVGFTADLPSRLAYHQRDEAGWTRGRGPWELVYCEEFAVHTEAMRREHALKSGQGRL